jgi:hypothetical protein
VHDYSLGLVENKYSLYVWCEEKIGQLIAVDGLLLGGLLVLLNTSGTLLGGSLLLFCCATVFLSFSLVLSLGHAIPKMNSGIGNEVNLRTVIGTEALKTEEYYKNLVGLSIEDMIWLNVCQLKGMNKIIMANRNAIRRAAIMTALGLIQLLGFLVSVTL